MSFPPLYWLMAVPVQGDTEKTRSLIVNSVGSSAKVHDFSIPSLKVGTLDQLMNLSDELAKHDQMFQGVVKKIQSSYQELVSSQPEAPKGAKGNVRIKDLKIDSKLPPEYVENFCWTKNVESLPNCIASMVKETAEKDEEIRNYSQKFNDIRTTLEAIERKAQGNLLVKNLNEFVNEKDLLDTEYITTLMVVVPRDKKKEFERDYWQLESKERARKQAAAEKKIEGIEGEEEEEVVEEKNLSRVQCDSIVPGSIKHLAEDEEFALYKINVLKKSQREMDAMRNLLRSERFAVRPFKYDPKEEAKRNKEQEDLSVERFDRWSHLVKFIRVNYGTVFTNYIHLKAVRVFVEGVLRYGLANGPPNYFFALVQPKKGDSAKRKVRKSLNTQFAELGDSNQVGSKEDQEALDSQFGEFFPYVSVDIDLQDDED